jgi:hypothetical protein
VKGLPRRGQVPSCTPTGSARSTQEVLTCSVVGGEDFSWGQPLHKALCLEGSSWPLSTSWPWSLPPSRKAKCSGLLDSVPPEQHIDLEAGLCPNSYSGTRWL